MNLHAKEDSLDAASGCRRLIWELRSPPRQPGRVEVAFCLSVVYHLPSILSDQVPTHPLRGS